MDRNLLHRSGNVLPASKKASQPIELSGFRIPTLLLAAVSLLQFGQACANGVGNLDAENRRAVREAQMSRFGSRDQGGSSNNLNRPGVVVQNDGRGRRNNCTTQVGQSNNYGTQHGMRVQQVTVVEGNIVNVCD